MPGKALSLKLYPPNPEKVMIFALAALKRPSDLNLLRMTLKAMQIIEDSATFEPICGAKNGSLNHPFGATTTLRQAEDEYLCPARLIKEIIAKTKDRNSKVRSSL